MNTRPNPTPPVLTTAKAAKTPSHLENLSKQVCNATLERKLFEMLKEKKIGTPALENQALRLEIDAKEFKGKQKGGPKKIKGRKTKFIRENRNPRKVVDLLKLKIRYCRALEERLRREYKEVRKEVEQGMKERPNRFRRLIKKISKDNTTRWNKGKAKVEDKVNWCENKFTMIPPAPEKETLEMWAHRVSEGRGKERPRIQVEVPIYGKVRPFDEDELKVMKLPPKWALFLKSK